MSRLKPGEVRALDVAITKDTFVCSCDIDKPIGSFAVLYRDKDGYKAEVQQFENLASGIQQARDWCLSFAKKYHTSDSRPRFIIESTGPYHSLTVKVFSEFFDVIVVNPYHVKSVLKSEGKDDIKDAVTLAKLLLSFDIRPSNLPTEPQYRLRKLMRLKRKMIDLRTQASNRLGTILTENSVPLPNVMKIMSVSGRDICAAIAKGTQDPTKLMAFWKGKSIKITPGLTFGQALEIERPNLDEQTYLRLREIYDALYYVSNLKAYHRRIIAQQLRLIDHYDGEIQSLEVEIAQAIENYVHINAITGEVLYTAQEMIDLLCTAPIFTEESAKALIAEAGIDFQYRYHSADALQKALGLSPEVRKSGGKLIGMGVSMGNKHFKPLIVQGATSFLRRRSSSIDCGKHLHDWGREYQARSDAQHARVAVARRVTRSAYFMAKRWEPYDDSRHRAVQSQSVRKTTKRVRDQVDVLKRQAAGNVDAQARGELHTAARELGEVLGVQMPLYKVPSFEGGVSITDLDLPSRARQALKAANIDHISTLVLMVMTGTLHQVRGIGEAYYEKIVVQLLDLGLLEEVA